MQELQRRVTDQAQHLQQQRSEADALKASLDQLTREYERVQREAVA